MKDKHFRIPEAQAKDLEVLCTILGISERQAGELALREWVRKNRSQVSLDTWTEARGSIEPVNRTLIAINLELVKAELREIEAAISNITPEYRFEFLRRIQKMLPTAESLVQETGDKELQEILASIAEKVQP